MKKHSLILLPALVLSACHSTGHPPAELQAEASVERSGVPQRCAMPASYWPSWLRDGATGNHFGCATAHNLAVQNMPHKPSAATGTDSTMAVSGVLRYRKGKVEPLRDPQIEAGASGGAR